MTVLTKLKRYLDAERVPYHVLTHPPAFTAREVARATDMPGHAVAKVVIAKAGRQAVMVVVPAPWRVDLEKVARVVTGRPLRLATEREVAALFPGCEVGAMPPFGNLFGMPVYLDRSLEDEEHLVFNAGSHTEALLVRCADFRSVVGPVVGDFMQWAGHLGPTARDELARALRRRRAMLLREFGAAEADLAFIGEDRESEIEERAQEEGAADVLARLDDRTLADVHAIDAALQRMIDGTYGRCATCDAPIPLTRLRAIPTARTCRPCAEEAEAAGTAPAEEMPPAHPGTTPADVALLSDREAEVLLREQLRDDGRLDLDELRVVCRHGIVHLDGVVPSETEHAILLELVQDVAGFGDVVDRVRVQALRHEPEVRAGEPPPPGWEPGPTEDVVESAEEGRDYVAPVGPPPTRS
jgi:Ala-tRNA(Pro) deacylase